MGESPINREITVNLDVLRDSGEWENSEGKTPIELANRLAAVKAPLTAERSQFSGKV